MVTSVAAQFRVISALGGYAGDAHLFVGEGRIEYELRDVASKPILRYGRSRSSIACC
ncbi:MAG: hypothetical protein O7H41_13265 [Planctomycetota bacterium]|nr:hypothetical protein [Planctomycetota bacterium]